MKNLLSILDNFSSKKIIVIGDIMLDHYLEGFPARMSPEAEIQIISITKEWFAPGGAGNTAVNIRGLGAKAILVGMVGSDAEFLERDLLWGINRKTILGDKSIVKFRILQNGRHIMRADKDGSRDYSTESTIDTLKSFLLPEVENCHAIVVSDYAKGLITEDFAKELVCVANKRNKMIIVDTKPKHFFWYQGAFCVKPNKAEAEEFSKIKIESMEDAERAGNYIKKMLGTNVLLTLGSMGMILFEEEKTTRFSSNAKDVFDVTGAGDTVLATFSLALAAGAKMHQAADLANHAASIVIAKSGTASVTLEELKKSIT